MSAFEVIAEPPAVRRDRTPINVKDFGAKGDGTADDTTALNAALARGGDVYLPDGTYMTSGVVFSTDATRLFGPGRLRHMVGATDAVVTIPGGVSGCAVEDVTVDCNEAQTGQAVGVLVRGGHHRLRGVTVLNAPNDGIVVASNPGGTRTTHSSVVGCTVVSAGRSGITVNGDLPDEARHVTISENHVITPRGMGVGVVGVAQYVSITDNVIEAPGQGYPGPPTGDGVTGYNANNVGLVVSGNVITDSLNNGIHVGGSGVTVANNVVSGTVNGQGIHVASDPNGAPTPSGRAVVTGNEVYNTNGPAGSGAAISVIGYSSVTVTGNVAADTAAGHGINVTNNAGTTDPANVVVISGNSLTQIGGGGTGNGIRVRRAKVVSITGNSLLTVATTAISVTDGGDVGLPAVQTESVVVSGNTVRTADMGVRVSGSATRVLIDGNVVAGCTTSTISTSGTGSGLRVRGNMTDDSGSVASAALLVVPLGLEEAHVTGTTNITAMHASSRADGRRLTLIFDGVLTVSDANNLKLAGDFASVAGAMLELRCDTDGNWYEVARSTGPEMEIQSSGGSVTLTPGVNAEVQVFTGSITADRSVKLSNTGALKGARFKITRTAAATGAFNRNINNNGGTLLKALAVSTWAEFVHDGTDWVLLQAGSL